MKRPNYKITDEQAMRFAIRWIQHQFLKYPDTFPTSASHSNSHQVFNDLLPNAKPEQVNAWCEQYLSTKQWHRLKNARHQSLLRARRKKGYKDPVVNVALSLKTYSALSALAKCEGITLSQTVSNLIASYLYSNNQHES